MAILDKNLFPLIGTIGDLTFYTVQGSDKIIVRTKGGPSRKQFKKSGSFAKARLHNKEFSGRIRACNLIVRAFGPLRKVADYHLSNALHKPLKVIQDHDVSSPLGQRRLRLSEHPKVLEGFPLNKSNSFALGFLGCTKYRISVTGEATLEIPHPRGMIRMLDQNFHSLRFCAVLAAVPDLHFVKGTYASASPDLPSTVCVHKTTPWLRMQGDSEYYILDLASEFVPPSGNFVWMLSVGLEFGYQVNPNEIHPAENHRAAMVIGVVPGQSS